MAEDLIFEFLCFFMILTKMQSLQLQPIRTPFTAAAPPPLPPALLCRISETVSKPRTLCFQESDPSRFRRQSITRVVSPKQARLYVLDRPTNSSTYASLMDSCICHEFGKQIHAHTLKTGFGGDEFVETKLLQLYGRSGVLPDARQLFDKMPRRNLHSWTAILRAHLDHGSPEDALVLFQELLFEDVVLEFFLFPVVFKICSGLGGLEFGKQLHGVVIKHQFVLNIYVGNSLIDMYGKCGSLADAQKALGSMPERDGVSWNSAVTACAANGKAYEALECLERMAALDNFVPSVITWSAVIGGFSQNRHDDDAMELLSRMQAAGVKPNSQTLASILPSCGRLQQLRTGKEIHCYILRHGYMTNSFVVNGLVDVYRRCHQMESALRIFLMFSAKNAFSFNTMIVGYCESGNISDARKLFDQMELMGVKKDIVSWNSMISGYVDNNLFKEALSMFLDLLMEEGIEANSFTLGSVITACADMGCLRQGWPIHGFAIVRGLQANAFVGGALVEMYCKCQDLRAGHKAFDEVSEPETATWNVLISGYAHCNKIEAIQNLMEMMKRGGFSPNTYTWNGIIAGHVENGHLELAMKYFFEMQILNLRPDIYTVGIILPVCSRLSLVERGKQVHAHSIRCAYNTDLHIGAALVDMYAKCGSIKHAGSVYRMISNPNLVSQNAMLTAYAMHGQGNKGIALFHKMLADGVIPDQVTFLSVLSSCVHVGLAKTGCELFDMMGKYNLKPSLKHYSCMVDLLSRACQLDEAHQVIKTMPMEADSVVWGALLRGCVTCQNVELGEIAAEKLLKHNPDDTSNYVLLANLYASAGRWSDVARTRKVIKVRGMHKNPGCSWIEDRNEVNVFLAGDQSHRRTDEIYTTLNKLNLHMNKNVMETVM